MILSRRSFLKVAGLTVVAAAGASMFTGCNASLSTPIEYESADNTLAKVVENLNKNVLSNSILGNSDLHKDAAENKKEVEKIIKRRGKEIEGVKTEHIVVKSAELVQKEKDGKKYYCIQAVLSMDQVG